MHVAISWGTYKNQQKSVFSQLLLIAFWPVFQWGKRCWKRFFDLYIVFRLHVWAYGVPFSETVFGECPVVA